ncbi:MAG: acyltransferase family protein [Lachnospiraceae bacterium]|nr:acyltransferase family protein [Lachnospiraceae bacterium]
MEYKRNYQFDNMKALLIFLVVLGHVFRNLGANGDNYVVYKIIFSFHMPAFLFISGYFMKYNPKKLFARLFPLYLLFQVIQTVERMAITCLQGGSLQDVRIDLFTPRWTLWYLVVLMAYQLLIPLIDTENRKHQLGFLILSVCLGLTIGITDDTDNFLAMSRAFSFLPFFLLGFYERKNHFMLTYGKERFPRASKTGAAVMAAFLIFSFWLHNRRIDPKDFFGSEDYADVSAFLWRLLGWVFAFLWIMILLIWVPEKRIPVVETIGSNTMSVYLVHGGILILLEASPLTGLIQHSIVGLTLLSVSLTLLLSWNGFERMLGKVRIHTQSGKVPYKPGNPDVPGRG